MSKTALIILDLQVEFTKHGLAPIQNITEITDKITRVVGFHHDLFEIILSTYKWHSPNAKFFKEFKLKKSFIRPSSEMVENGKFAGARPILNESHFPLDKHVCIYRGVSESTTQGGYSLFTDDDKSTNALTILKNENCQNLIFSGISFNNCMINSVHEAIHHGFNVQLLEDSFFIMDDLRFGKSSIQPDQKEIDVLTETVPIVSIEDLVFSKLRDTQ